MWVQWGEMPSAHPVLSVTFAAIPASVMETVCAQGSIPTHLTLTYSQTHTPAPKSMHLQLHTCFQTHITAHTLLSFMTGQVGHLIV